MFSGEAVNIHFIIIGLKGTRLDPTNCHNRDEHVNHYGRSLLTVTLSKISCHGNTGRSKPNGASVTLRWSSHLKHVTFLYLSKMAVMRLNIAFPFIAKFFYLPHGFFLCIISIFITHRIGGVMFSVLDSRVVDRGFETRLGQTKG